MDRQIDATLREIHVLCFLQSHMMGKRSCPLTKKKWPQIQNRSVILFLTIPYQVFFQQANPTLNIIKNSNEVPGVSSSFSHSSHAHTHKASGTTHVVKSKIFILKKGGLTFQSSSQHKCAGSHLSRTGLSVQRQ